MLKTSTEEEVDPGICGWIFSRDLTNWANYIKFTGICLFLHPRCHLQTYTTHAHKTIIYLKVFLKHQEVTPSDNGRMTVLVFPCGLQNILSVMYMILKTTSIFIKLMKMLIFSRGFSSFYFIYWLSTFLRVADLEPSKKKDFKYLTYPFFW